MVKNLLSKEPPNEFEPSPSENISFNSLFEGGNLDKVYKFGEKDYRLYLRADSNTKGFFQWFYFCIHN